MNIFDESAKRLASAVLVQTVTDIRAQGGDGSATYDVKNGGIDLYLAIMGMDMDGQEFLDHAKRRGK